MSKHDDVTYDLAVTVDGKPLTMEITTSPLPEVAAKHVERIVNDHNDRNKGSEMQLVSFQKKSHTLQRTQLAAEKPDRAKMRGQLEAAAKKEPKPEAQPAAADTDTELTEAAGSSADKEE